MSGPRPPSPPRSPRPPSRPSPGDRRLATEVIPPSPPAPVSPFDSSSSIAALSHEIKAPLSAVIGFSDLLLSQQYGALSDTQADFLRDIRDSGGHLLEILEEVLDFSRLVAGRVSPSPSPCAIGEVISAAMAVVRPLLSNRMLHLEVAVDGEPSPMVTDSLRLRQIVVNLLSNAIKFTPDGGRIQVAARQAGPFMDIAVRDTGIGISPADLRWIFEPYTRIAPPESAPAPGTGLGLAVVDRLARLLGGSVRVRSRPGVGSTFTVRVPLLLHPEPVPGAPPD